MKKNYTYKLGGQRILSGILIIMYCTVRSIVNFFLWLWHLICSHKIATALVVSIILNFILFAIHLNDRAREETASFRYYELEKKYDGIRGANIRFTSHNNTKL